MIDPEENRPDTSWAAREYNRRTVLAASAIAAVSAYLAAQAGPFVNLPAAYADTTGIESVISGYDVTWTTPSTNAGDAMPIGNGNIAALVWAENNGDLRLRVALNDSWDENSRSIGLSNFRVSFTPNPFASGAPFKQTLQHVGGRVIITAGLSPTITTMVWVDANKPVIHIETSSGASTHAVKVTSERWRTSTQTVTNTPWMDFIHVADFNNTSPLTVQLTADTVATDQANKIFFYHRNETSHWAETAVNQSITTTGLTDPYTYRTTGAVVQGTNLVSTNAETLTSSAANTGFRIDIAALTQVASDVNTFKSGILNAANATFGTDIETLRSAHNTYWSAFWNKSYVIATGDATADQATTGWIVARYLMALQGRSEGMIEFNGGAFTLQNDTKMWHDYTQFNERFAYWSMMPSGDNDLMQAYFDIAVNALPVITARSQALWGHGGGVLPEHMIFGGFQSGSHHGWNRTNQPPTYIADDYTRLLYEGTPEIAVMMIDYYSYSGDASFVTNKLLPFCKSVVTWYDKHWPRVNGLISMYPIYSGEADRNVTNPSAEVGALRRLLSGLLTLPTNLTSATDRTYWQSIQSQLPAVPVQNGKIMTAQDLARGVETNNQNLFTVFPYRLWGQGMPDLQTGIDTYLDRVGKAPGSGNQDWRHDADHAAYLGLTDEARMQMLLAFTRYKYRYVGFIDGDPDGPHSIQPLAIGKIALQAMLVQPIGTAIHLMNAWPANWNVNFKLWAPQATSLQGQISGGVVSGLTVNPSTRASDVIVRRAAPPVATGTAYTFTNVANGLVLDVTGARIDGGAPIIQTATTIARNQIWTPVVTSAGYFKLINANSGLALVVQGASNSPGAPLIQYAYSGDGTYNDEWRIDDIGGGFHQIINRQSGLAIAASPSGTGTALTQQAPNGNDLQRFRLTRPVGPGQYSITVASSGYSLDVVGANTGNNAAVVQWPYAGGANQKWAISYTDSGYVKLLALHSGKALVVQSASTTPENIIQYDYTADSVQNDEWQIIDGGSGFYELVNRRSGLLLTAPDSNQGTQFRQAARAATTSQRFRLAAV